MLQASDNSGIIGAAIVGGFALVVANWYLGKWIAGRWGSKQHANDETTMSAPT